MKKVFQFVSTNTLGGLENVVINICTLVKGYNYVYVSPSGLINKYLSKYHIKHIIVNKLTPISVRKIIKKYHPDIVHGHDVKASLCLALNAHLCHNNNIKIVSELHSDDTRMHRYSIRSILYAIFSQFYDKIIVVSNSVKDHYIFRHLIRNKVVVIRNIMNTYRILKDLNDKNEYKKKWDCIFLGRLANPKNPLRFVKIIYKLKKKDINIKAIIVGDGDLYNKIVKYIKNLKLTNNILMVGFKSNPFKYLIQSKILIMPSKYEGISLAALESLFLGIPVICSYTSGGLVNIISNKCGYLANSNQDYCNKVYKLLKNNNLYKTKSLNSKRKINQINNIKLFVLKYRNVYSSK